MSADNKTKLLHADVTDRILACFFDVYNELGHGFIESVYEKSLAIELKKRGAHVERQQAINVHFKGALVGEFVADLIVDQVVILELKAVSRLDPVHQAQLLNYLRATRIEVGLLLNFGPKPQFERFVFENARKTIRA